MAKNKRMRALAGALILVGLALAGCRSAPVPVAVQPAPGEPIVLSIWNNHPLDVRVLALERGVWMSVAVVPGNMSVTIDLPASAALYRVVRLRVEPIGIVDWLSLPAVTVLSGEQLELQIERQLQFSRLRTAIR